MNRKGLSYLLIYYSNNAFCISMQYTVLREYAWCSERNTTEQYRQIIIAYSILLVLNHPLITHFFHFQNSLQSATIVYDSIQHSTEKAKYAPSLIASQYIQCGNSSIVMCAMICINRTPGIRNYFFPARTDPTNFHLPYVRRNSTN